MPYINYTYCSPYPPIQSTTAPGLLYFPDEFLPEFYKECKRAAGFVDIAHDGEKVTSCVWTEEAYQEWAKANPEQPTAEDSEYIPTPEQSAVVLMRSVFSTQVADMDDDMVIQCSGLADTWQPGNHKTGEVYNAGDQTWECFQSYDNAVYPGVTPENAAWRTFNRPLHGKSLETARPFVQVQGAHDMYRKGEYMIFTDNRTYMCLKDTNYSPDEYAADWEVV